MGMWWWPRCDGRRRALDRADRSEWSDILGWRPGGWTGWRHRLGENKEAFDAEVYVIYQVLCLCYLQEASLAQLIRTTTEARTQGTGDWITSHVKSSRCYRPLKGGSTRPDLRKERKE